MALPTFTPGTTIKASEMNQALATLFDMAHPVGSYYETSDTDFNPNNEWPGTWVEDTGGRVLVAQGSSPFTTVGGTGGEAYHVLTGNEMPNHKHAIFIAGNGGGSWTGIAGSPSNQWAGWNDSFVAAAGGNAAHNNLQPYIVVKRWHRTA